MALERFTLKLGLIAVLLTVAGCSVYHGEYSVLSNRVLDLKGFDPVRALQRRNYGGGTSERRIFGVFPDRNDFPTLDEAIDRALEEGGGDLILNAQVLRWHWQIPLIYGTSGWKVTGDVVDTGSGGQKVQPVDPWSWTGLLAGG